MPKQQYLKCLRCHHPRNLYSRGLCLSCYQFYRRKIQDGVYSWEDLELTGWSLPRNMAGRKTPTGDDIVIQPQESSPNMEGGVVGAACQQCTWQSTTADFLALSIQHKKQTNHLMRAIFRQQPLEVVAQPFLEAADDVKPISNKLLQEVEMTDRLKELAEAIFNAETEDSLKDKEEPAIPVKPLEIDFQI